MHADIDELFINIDAKLDRILDRLQITKAQVTNRHDMAANIARRLDRIDGRLESITKRLNEQQS
jgi:hypothetical protein